MKRREFLKCLCAAPVIGIPAVCANKTLNEIDEQIRIKDYIAKSANKAVKWRKYTRNGPNTFVKDDIHLTKADIDRVVKSLIG